METLRPYPTDLTDDQWTAISSLVPEAKPGGRPAKYQRRELVNALLYIMAVRCRWRALPRNLPPWNCVYGYYRRWTEDGTLHLILEAIDAGSPGTTPMPMRPSTAPSCLSESCEPEAVSPSAPTFPIGDHP